MVCVADHPGQFIIIVVALSQGSQGPQRAGAGDMGRQRRGPATCAGNVGPRSAAESARLEGDHQRPGGSLFWTLLVFVFWKSVIPK